MHTRVYTYSWVCIHTVYINTFVQMCARMWVSISVIRCIIEGVSAYSGRECLPTEWFEVSTLASQRKAKEIVGTDVRYRKGRCTACVHHARYIFNSNLNVIVSTFHTFSFSKGNISWNFPFFSFSPRVWNLPTAWPARHFQIRCLLSILF